MNVESTPGLIQVAQGVHAWIGKAGDSNAGVIDTPRGLVAIDAQQTAAQGRRFREAAEVQLGKPVCSLLNTHFHLDHIAGNIAFADVPIVAHRHTRRRLEAELGPASGDVWQVSDTLTKLRLFFGGNIGELVSPDDPGMDWFRRRVSGPDYDEMTLHAPTESFADEMTLHLRDDALHAAYWGPAHCDGDVVVHLPRSGVVFLGDLLFVGRFPWFGDCDLNGWIACLDRVLQMDVRVVIPGHGPPATLQEVSWFRDLLAATRDAVADARKRGLSEEATVASVHLGQYAGMPRYDAWMPFNLRAAYRYLNGD